MAKRTPPKTRRGKSTRAKQKAAFAAESYINRELSMLEFNRRVLAQARDESVPLLERLRFLTICSTNLDEFFEIRVSGLKQQEQYGVKSRRFDGLTPLESLARISKTAHGLVEQQYALLNDVLIPGLAAEGTRVLRRDAWSERAKRFVKTFFQREVMPVLTPIALDPAHPFPRVLNKSLNFIVSVEGTDAFGRDVGLAVVQVPRALPRMIALPSGRRGRHDFVMLSSVIHAHVRELFPGMKVRGCFQFRVTRNSDLWVDEEEVENLLQALKGQLPSRRYGAAVRLEVADTCPEEAADHLLQQLQLTPDDLYRVNGPVNLYRLAQLHDLLERPDLKYPPFVAGLPRRLTLGRDIFTVLRIRDVLVHHPYESFAPVLELIRSAATDPKVLAIKVTLYRTQSGSPLVEALVEAARKGKEVTVLVELRARFDEAANIDLATRLEEVGANVVYGIVGYKTHCKMLMVVRREEQRLRRYVHLGTGNYHTGTVRAYTDFGLLSADLRLGEDVHRLFMQLTGLGKVHKLKKLLQAPFTLFETLLRLIADERDAALAGKPARIVAKMNSLSERDIIDALYAASQAGVKIDLIVRGICCLRPGVPGLSENIRVRSIVGRFLEHTRIFSFHAGGEELVYMSSADWMSRNLHRRVETCFPVLDKAAKARVVDEGLKTYLSDNTQAWLLQSDGRYRRAKPGKSAPVAAQTTLLQRLAE